VSRHRQPAQISSGYTHSSNLCGRAKCTGPRSIGTDNSRRRPWERIYAAVCSIRLVEPLGAQCLPNARRCRWRPASHNLVIAPVRDRPHVSRGLGGVGRTPRSGADSPGDGLVEQRGERVGSDQPRGERCRVGGSPARAARIESCGNGRAQSRRRRPSRLREVQPMIRERPMRDDARTMRPPT
jgi:hypothetical protein